MPSSTASQRHNPHRAGLLRENAQVCGSWVGVSKLFVLAVAVAAAVTLAFSNTNHAKYIGTAQTGSSAEAAGATLACNVTGGVNVTGEGGSFGRIRDRNRTRGSASLVVLQPPVVVFGAEDRIGTLCIIGLAEQGERVIAISRERVTPDSMIVKMAYGVHYVHADIHNPKTYQRYFARAKAVIFASSARSVFDQDKEILRFRNGDTPKNVEYRGMRIVAKSATAHKVKRIIMVSMYMLTRTKDPVYKWLNKYKRAMYWKRQAELSLINECNKSNTSSYTIVRAGGSTGDKGFGPDKVILRQGDYVRGTLPLEDLANITVASLYTNQTKNTVFEAITGDEGIDIGFGHLVENDGSSTECPPQDIELTRAK
mmetsp:Transcript_24844/g.44205  ORF Transcript_24844/g.44205 Transcript_24844/m.44205 type:complete len:369 (-) Transcript_24844:95-1201(-)